MVIIVRGIKRGHCKIVRETFCLFVLLFVFLFMILLVNVLSSSVAVVGRRDDVLFSPAEPGYEVAVGSD